jgi:hypothetical protein
MTPQSTDSTRIFQFYYLLGDESITLRKSDTFRVRAFPFLRENRLSRLRLQNGSLQVASSNAHRCRMLEAAEDSSQNTEP